MLEEEIQELRIKIWALEYYLEYLEKDKRPFSDFLLAQEDKQSLIDKLDRLLGLY